MDTARFLKDLSFQFMEVMKTAVSPPVPKLPVKGEFAGQPVETTVDSELARYYLENYLTNQKTQPKLDHLIEQIEAEHQANFPSRESLKKLTDQYSVDFATLYLTKRILEIPANEELHSYFLNAYEEVQRASQAGDSLYNPHLSSCIFLIVPAWDYVEMGPEIGTDFADTRKLLDQIGAENHLLAIEPVGSVERNAEIVAREILRFSQQTTKALILVSGSSSGPAVAHALGEILEPQQLQQVKCWVNAVGILQGASFVDVLLSRPLCWGLRVFLLVKKWKFEDIESMSMRIRRERFQQVSIPRDIFILNYLSIPVSGNISQFARMAYKVIRKQGPNDGSALILDTMVPDGISIVSFGTDHFINFDPQIPLKVAAIGQTVVHHLKLGI